VFFPEASNTVIFVIMAIVLLIRRGPVRKGGMMQRVDPLTIPAARPQKPERNFRIPDSGCGAGDCAVRHLSA